MKDLKLLVRDYSVRAVVKSSNDERVDANWTIQPIANNALTILINISVDHDFLKLLAEDDAFLETLLGRVTVCQLPHLYTPHYLSADF